MANNHEDVVTKHETLLQELRSELFFIGKSLQEIKSTEESRIKEYHDHLVTSIERRARNDSDHTELERIRLCVYGKNGDPGYFNKTDQNMRDICAIKTGHKEIRAWAITILISILGTTITLAYIAGGRMNALDSLLKLHDRRTVEVDGK